MATKMTTLSIQGMHCSACVRRVERALSKLEGVSSAKVDLEAGKAVVEHDPAVATEAAMRAAVDALGYTVSG